MIDLILFRVYLHIVWILTSYHRLSLRRLILTWLTLKLLGWHAWLSLPLHWLARGTWSTGWSLLELLLLHHLSLSLLHLLHHSWIKSVLVYSASQMVGGEQNVDVVSVEDLVQILGKVLHIHLRRYWQSLNEEHRVLENDWVWILVLFPNDLDGLTVSCWNETLLWNYLHVHLG